MPLILFAGSPDEWDAYQQTLPAALKEAGVEAELTAETPADPACVDYIVTSPAGRISDYAPFVNCRLVQNLWAGVERITGNATLTQPLARMVDPALTQGMVEYVTGHVLRLHLRMDDCLQDGRWRRIVPPLAAERTVVILGLGELGQAVAGALGALGFRPLGWSRRPHDVPGVETHSGAEGLSHVLSQAEILVTLLPLTPETDGLLNAARLALLPKGASIINPGRGPLIMDEALLEALDAGHVSRAVLDVFREEPLPPGHSFWAHPKVFVTPHIAAATRPATASRVAAENIRRGEAGEPLLHLVDRGAGY
ncbi:glyoxylate/hydroxypyruvate reductase A [Haematobacter massiliensis]|uniref:Hydroxyacid dehydrogenase n=1 Tax=Haematobacter massiliensis TaxID=195105 RepID=A0A086XXM0_9RHOB|nr:glyoxylate/hydroxypyruvate reductase A [Haematobacter massiliensis]KFI26770.1 hydroxyacid dehydrogenase [Haematobacter massiliensis]OWJ69511.1 glyoxylate/hydroxypyruvate reductase A [Haematobacter massiliensis]OWJ87625.1 glyoxylate/hydroxypyruvate reductase A [Haematobacter massiliensis]QBJ23693.1 glyoxylate/hydroxypyruvate reductase A [Haematobacter massiliensis]